MSTHDYYQARLEKQFRHSCAVARRRGLNPSGILETAELSAMVDTAVPRSADSAERIAARIEKWFLAGHAEKGGPGYWPDLIRYEAALFRADAIGHVERQATPGTTSGHRPVRRSPSARIIALEHDIPSLVVRLDHLDDNDPLPWAVPEKPTRLLIAMSPHGVLRVVRASDALESFLKTVDGVRDFDLVVDASGMDREAAQAALRSLIEIGAVED